MSNQHNHNEFDAEFYRTYYIAEAAIAEMTDAEAMEHFDKHGRAEHRYPSPDALIKALELLNEPLPDNFDEAFYLAEHADVRMHFTHHRGGAAHFLQYGRHEGRSYSPITGRVYDHHTLNLLTNRIYDLPVVRVDERAPVRVNVLVPAFEFKSMSAGFFGVFQVARRIKRCGFNVRLVMFDNFYWNEAEFRELLKGYPDMENLFDELEVAYIGERKLPLVISPFDNCVATVWYSAWFAHKIMEEIGGKPFLYLIQDYETNFFPGSAHNSFADASYEMNYKALFSTKPLMDYFLLKGIGCFGKAPPEHTYFNNATAASLSDRDTFLNQQDRPYRIALYSRPVVHRNMFELAGMALCQAFEEGVFTNGRWEFFGIGLGDAAIRLSSTVTLRQLPRMNLKQYQALISTFDVGLSLMASPHPSLLPFDLGGSGALVVTNTFGTKQQSFFDPICQNIIAKSPNVPDLVTGLREAVERVSNRAARYDSAAAMAYPLTWEETFTPAHDAFFQACFVGSEPRRGRSLKLPFRRRAKAQV